MYTCEKNVRREETPFLLLLMKEKTNHVQRIMSALRPRQEKSLFAKEKRQVCGQGSRDFSLSLSLLCVPHLKMMKILVPFVFLLLFFWMVTRSFQEEYEAREKANRRFPDFPKVNEPL